MISRDKASGTVSKLLCVVACSILVSGVALAQGKTEGESQPEQKTKQAQAVSKAVYDKILKAQEEIDAENYTEALSQLNRLMRQTKPALTEYEQINILNYIGFVQFSVEDTRGAMDTYRKLLAILSLEEQMRKATLYTLAQLSTMEEEYSNAIK